MGSAVSAILLLALAGLLPAQSERLPAVRVLVSADGMYRLPFERLAPHIDLKRIRTSDLGMFREGRSVPLLIQGGSDGQLQRGDSVIFYGERNRGPHSRTACYVLKPTRSPRRIRRLEVDRDPDAADEAWRELSVEDDRVFVPLATVVQKALRSKPEPARWFWASLPAPTGKKNEANEEGKLVRRFELQPAPRQSAPAQLLIDVMGPAVAGVPQKIAVTINGNRLPDLEWNEPLAQRLSLTVPPRILQAKNRLEIENVSPVPAYHEPGNEVRPKRRNRIEIDRATLRYACLLAGPGRPREQINYRLPHDVNRDLDVIRIANRYREGFDLYDVARGAFIQPKQVRLARGRDTVLCCVGSGSYLEVDDVQPLRKSDRVMLGEGAEYVVIATQRFARFVKPLLRLRESQGLKTMLVEPQEIYDSFSHGDFTPEAISRFMRRAHKSWKRKPRHLLLVGDADLDVDWLSQRETIPTRLVRTDYNGYSGTDALFGDVNDDGVPEVAVGRLPVRTPDELIGLVRRIVALETAPPSGPWRRDLRFVAGEARFGPQVDAVLERTFRGVISKEIPPGYRIGLTWASPTSPFFWPPMDFSNHVIESLERGSLVFTYVGHASSRALDQVRVGDQRYAMLDESHVERVRTGGRTPVMALIACWTGEFDHPERDCLAELLLRSADGPVAVIAASRISHPYPDALLGRGLTRQLFRSPAPLGAILDGARRDMLAGRKGALALLARPFLSKAIDPGTLVQDHVYLYNLLGDPALRLPRPVADLKVKPAATTVTPGAGLDVEIEVGEAAAGRLIVTLDVPSGYVDPAVAAVPLDSPEAEARIIEANRQVNRRSLVEVEVPIDGPRVSVKLPVPAALSCKRLAVVAYLAGETADRMGVAEVIVTPK